MLPFSVLDKTIILPQYELLPKGYASIGEVLKEYRTKNNLSLSEVARQLAVFPSNVRHWEKGGMPNIVMHNRILKLLKLHYPILYFSSFRTLTKKFADI